MDRRSGACTSQWVPAIEAPDSIPVPLLSPGQATDLSILLQVPSTPGVYEGRWRLCCSEVRIIIIWCRNGWSLYVLLLLCILLIDLTYWLGFG